MADGAKVRAWCFTINNPTHKVLFPDGLPDGIKYIVYQLDRVKSGALSDCLCIYRDW